MRISFLSGPAGSGKTFRCLDEIRSELSCRPAGDPLVFLAPKQATFQLERQLLEPGSLRGYSRLRILSFERAARFVFDELGRAVPELLSDQGRTMVLRAILEDLQPKLVLFRGPSRRPGFAEELGKQLREFSNLGLSPEQLRALAENAGTRGNTRQKLIEFALILSAYRNWIEARQLEDSDALLTLAAELLDKTAPETLRISGLWFDGFAQLTPQERGFLMALLARCDHATLAFCLDPGAVPKSPISSWYLTGQTFGKLFAEIRARFPKCHPVVERLERASGPSRFAHAPDLAHLEANWAKAAPEAAPGSGVVQLVECSEPEAEVTACARRIVKFIRGGGRYREAAVLLRGFENDYPHLIRRVFRSYGIPFFLDHRESVAHHPLAELTRGALRTLAFDFRRRDWFSVLKCGLVRLAPDLEELENHALARGWEGKVWREGLKVPGDPGLERAANERRAKLVPPFLRLSAALGVRPDGRQMAAGLRELWKMLHVEQTLEEWAKESSNGSMHSTVWEQMNEWLKNIELAFAERPIAIKEWLPIIEAGLASLTVGVIPPVLDEVLAGAVDRSRNPDLRLVCLLGLNERVFPAVPRRETLLTEEDRASLGASEPGLADMPSLLIAQEQFYGYIACTRARENLHLSYARTGTDGKALNPSRFVARLQQIFPDLKAEIWKHPATASELVHPCEMPWIGIDPALVAEGREPLAPADPGEALAPALVERIFGRELDVSVSAMERFAACPFRFFAERVLKISEREEFQLDVREQGSFQHEVLARFHTEVAREGKKWRDLAPAEAQGKIRAIAEDVIAKFKDGLLLANEQNRFTASNYTLALQKFIGRVIEWFQNNKFDPAAVELGFGGKGEIPPWRIPLSGGKSLALRGRVDRIDLYEAEGETFCVIADYKSGAREPSKILMYHGIQQQLTAYLLAVTRLPEMAQKLGAKSLEPGGSFLIPLFASADSQKTRRDALAEENRRGSNYMHQGVFDVTVLPHLDDPSEKSGQFYYSVTATGKPNARSFRALERERFDEMLRRTEELLRDAGERIYKGEIAPHPWKRGGETACDQCRMNSICRFDPWTQRFNTLGPVPEFQPNLAP